MDYIRFGDHFLIKDTIQLCKKRLNSNYKLLIKSKKNYKKYKKELIFNLDSYPSIM